MNRSKLAVKNSLVGLLSQIVTIVLQFIARSVFIKYLGVEILGISSTFSSVLSTLSLAELGFESAIVYLLYQPLADGDYDRVNRIQGVLQRVYTVLGCAMLAAGALCLPFLSYILKGVEVDGYIRLIFMLQVCGAAITYFMAHHQTLMYADQKSYITKIVKMCVYTVSITARIVLVYLTHNYLIYLITSILQDFIVNLIVFRLNRKYHPYYKRAKFDWEIFREAKQKVKDVFVARIAGYVYKATDSIVVSAFVGTVNVGFMVNYTTITTSVSGICKSILAPIAPIIGNLLAKNKDQQSNEEILRHYTYIRFCLAGAAVIPLYVLLQSFICAWIGDEYLLSDIIVSLYCIDLYISLVHSALCDFIKGQGLFKDDKRIEIIGALSNLSLSVILAQFMGIAGVLVGTVVSQAIFWFGRSKVVYSKCFPEIKGGLTRYWLIQGAYIAYFAAAVVLLRFCYSYINISFFPLRFVVGGIVCEAVFGVGLLLLFRKTNEHRGMVKILKKGVGK